MGCDFKRTGTSRVRFTGRRDLLSEAEDLMFFFQRLKGEITW